MAGDARRGSARPSVRSCGRGWRRTGWPASGPAGVVYCSVSVSSPLALAGPFFCVLPEGQVTSTLSTDSAAPRPKYSG